MGIEKLIAYCLSKPYTREDYPFGPELTAIVAASRMFALISCRDILLKSDPFMAQSLKAQYTSITPGNFLSEDNWITIKLDGSIPEDELYWLIDHSYELVLKSLTKSERESIGQIKCVTTPI